MTISLTQIGERLEAIDWTSAYAHLDGRGWATLDNVLNADECRSDAN